MAATPKPRRTPSTPRRTPLAIDQDRKAATAWEMRQRAVTVTVIMNTPWAGPSAHEGRMYGTRKAVYEAVRRVQAQIDAEEPAPDLNAMRTEMRQRNEQLMYEAGRVLRRGQPVLDRTGRVVTDPATGQPLRDANIDIAAIRLMLAAEAQLAKLYGLDAATKYEHSGPEGGPIPLEERARQLRDRLRSIPGGLTAVEATTKDRTG